MPLLAAVCLAVQASAQNPIVQTSYTADPAPMVWNGRVYLYTSHDEDASTWFTMNDWKLYSTEDMVNWTDHGSVLSYKTFAWAKGDAWAMQCVERDGKFYAYVPVTTKQGGGAIGVAVADSPYGPFYDPLGRPLVSSGKGDIDPSVMIDDDGQAYLYWGNPFCYYVKLNRDMISYSGEIVKVPMTEEAFGRREGNEALPGGSGFTRSVCVEKVEFNSDGTIKPMKMTEGISKGLTTLNPYRKTEAETMAFSEGMKSGWNKDVGVFVRAMRNGAYTKVKGVDFGKDGASKISLRIGTTHNDGVTLEVHADSQQGPLLASVKVPRTGGDDRWALVTADVASVKGVHDLYFVCNGDKPGCVMYFDYWMLHAGK